MLHRPFNMCSDDANTYLLVCSNSWFCSPSSSVLLLEQESGSVPTTVPPCGEYRDTSGRLAALGGGPLIPAPPPPTGGTGHTGESGVPVFLRGGGTGRDGLFPCWGPCWPHLSLSSSTVVSFSSSLDPFSPLFGSSSGAPLPSSAVSPCGPALLPACSSPPPPPSCSILAAGFCPFSLPFPSPASRLPLFLVEDDEEEEDESARQSGAGGSGGTVRTCTGTGGLDGGGGGETGIDFLSSRSTEAPTRASSFLLAAGATDGEVSGGGGVEKRRPVPGEPEPRLGGRGGGRLYLVSGLEKFLVGPLTSTVCWGSPFCRQEVLV